MSLPTAIYAGDVIVGLASSGKAKYEKEYNGGMGSNGLTSARHDIFESYLRGRYPESFDPGMPAGLVYSGSLKLTDIVEDTGIEAGRLVLSPTRTYAPVIREILLHHRPGIHGMVHCSGGAQTKVLNFIDNLHVIKDNMFDIPPLFRIIQEQSETGWHEMYKVFNMGHRFELYVPPGIAGEIIEISESFGVEARVVGYCRNSEGRKLTIRSGSGEFEYK
jgi:phosphoribosylformylglycinamidine cyclo-ligase